MVDRISVVHNGGNLKIVCLELFATKWDAERAISRLNGFRLFGSRILVSFAKFGNRLAYWKKKSSPGDRIGGANQKIPHRNEDGGSRDPPDKGKLDSESCQDFSQTMFGDPLRQKALNRTKIIGFIEEEKLWKLQKCLVGYSTTEVDSNSIHDRLVRWGLGEISVKRLAGRVFLLEIIDETLYNSLKDAKWSYLLEVFVEASLFIVGTIRPLNELQRFGIEAVVDIKVGSDCFPVRISEILSPEERAVAVHNPSKSTVRISHPSSASSSGPGDSAVAEKVDVNPLDACDDINSISLGNLNFSHENLECPETNRHIGVHELQGGTIQSGPGLDAGRKSWSEVVSGRAVGPDPVQGQRFAYSGEIERVAALRSLECASLDGPNPSNGHCIAEVLENVIPKKSGPSLIQESDQGFVGAPRSPMRLGNWGESVDIIHNSLTLNHNTDKISHSCSEEERALSAEDIICGNLNWSGFFADDVPWYSNWSGPEKEIFMGVGVTKNKIEVSRVPRGVLADIDRLRRNFIWGTSVVLPPAFGKSFAYGGT
ncbi:hypothetical protein V6N13_090693 [Hibiscus sabdariffa]